MDENETEKGMSTKLKKVIVGCVAAVLVIVGVGIGVSYDGTAPEIDVLTQTAELGEPVAISDLVSASDNRDASPEILVTDLPSGVKQDGDSLVFIDTGEFEIHAKATDRKNNTAEKTFSVNVSDTKAPVFREQMISTAGYGTVLPLVASRSFEGGIYAYADDKSDVTYKIESVVPVDSSLDADSYKIIDEKNVSFTDIGMYNVNVIASDKYGNISKGIAQVNIVDKTPPVISKSKSSFSITAGAGAPDYASYVSARDELSGACHVDINDSNVNYDTPGTYTVIYTTNDENGNTVTDSAEVVVDPRPEPKATVSQSSGSYSSSGRSSNGSSSSSSGAASQQNISSSSESGQTVYITRTGSKYHRNGCQYLSRSQIPISLGEARAEGYTACSRCW